MYKCAIWGTGDLGLYVEKQLKCYFPHVLCIAYLIDKNAHAVSEQLHRMDVYEPLKLAEEKPDYLIVCSKNYEEIIKVAVEQYGIISERILYVTTIWKEYNSLFPRLSWEKLTFSPLKGRDISELTDYLSQSDGKLNEIGIKNGTDKASIIVEPDGGFRLAHNYLRYYERYFSLFKENLRICEFGSYKGASLRTWSEYRENTLSVGVDIDESVKQLQNDRIKIVVGNVTDLDTHIRLKEEFKSFNIIIDDASHAWGDIRSTFEMMWDLLESGGLYILEDLYCGAQGSFSNYPPKRWEAQSIWDYLVDRTKILEYGMDWNPEYNRHHFYFLPPDIQRIEREISSMTYINGACIVEKR